MRLTHVADERLFVDDAGPTVSVVDAASGEIRKAQMFVVPRIRSGTASSRPPDLAIV
jgi:hypothetical protein